MAGPPRQLLLKDFLKSKHYRIPHGLKIDSVGQGLLKLLYDTKTGMMEELDFAKRMRTPWVIKIGEFGMIYSNIQHMMEQCKTIMADDPSEKDLCEELIHNCKEMLRIVGSPSSRRADLLRFPLDVRHEIYEMAIGNPQVLVHQCSNATHQYVTCPTGSCAAAPKGDICTYDLTEVLALAQTCKQVRGELFKILYQNSVLYFSCTCALAMCLRNNQFVRDHIRRIKLHLRGPEACIAISLLNRCPNLRHLEITVSRYTTFYVTGHDYKQLSTQQQRRVAFEDNDVLKEARGVRQLLAIGGLKSVQVTHAYNLKRGKAEVNGFEAFLKERLEPRRADTSQAGDDDAAKMLNVKVDELTAWLDKMMKR